MGAAPAPREGQLPARILFARDSKIAFLSPAKPGIHSEAEFLSRAPEKQAR